MDSTITRTCVARARCVWLAAGCSRAAPRPPASRCTIDPGKGSSSRCWRICASSAGEPPGVLACGPMARASTRSARSVALIDAAACSSMICTRLRESCAAEASSGWRPDHGFQTRPAAMATMRNAVIVPTRTRCRRTSPAVTGVSGFGGGAHRGSRKYNSVAVTTTNAQPFKVSACHAPASRPAPESSRPLTPPPVPAAQAPARLRALRRRPALPAPAWRARATRPRAGRRSAGCGAGTRRGPRTSAPGPG